MAGEGGSRYQCTSTFKKFELRNLFQGSEWEGLSKGNRITFGKFFKAEVLGGRFENVIFLDRAKNNHSKYQKIEGDTK